MNRLENENEQLKDQNIRLQINHQELKMQFVSTRKDLQRSLRQAKKQIAYLSDLKDRHSSTIQAQRKAVESHESKLLEDEFSQLLKMQQLQEDTRRANTLLELQLSQAQQSLADAEGQHEEDRLSWASIKEGLQEANKEQALQIEGIQVELEGCKTALWQATRTKQEEDSNIPSSIEWDSHDRVAVLEAELSRLRNNYFFQSEYLQLKGQPDNVENQMKETLPSIPPASQGTDQNKVLARLKRMESQLEASKAREVHLEETLAQVIAGCNGSGQTCRDEASQEESCKDPPRQKYNEESANVLPSTTQLQLRLQEERQRLSTRHLIRMQAVQQIIAPKK